MNTPAVRSRAGRSTKSTVSDTAESVVDESGRRRLSRGLAAVRVGQVTIGRQATLHSLRQPVPGPEALDVPAPEPFLPAGRLAVSLIVRTVPEDPYSCSLAALASNISASSLTSITHAWDRAQEAALASPLGRRLGIVVCLHLHDGWWRVWGHLPEALGNQAFPDGRSFRSPTAALRAARRRYVRDLRAATAEPIEARTKHSRRRSSH
jgi:hypothetical protein